MSRTLSSTSILEIACYSRSGDEYHAKVTRIETEALQLINAGFDYVCDMGVS